MNSENADQTVMAATGSAAFVGLAEDASGAAGAVASEIKREATGRLGQLTVEIDGVEIDGVRKVGLPRRINQRSADDDTSTNSKAQWGNSAYGQVRLERGLSPDGTVLFDWRDAVERGDTEAGLKSLAVTVLDEKSQSRIRWEFTAAWPTEYDPPKLDSTADEEIAKEAVAIDFETVERTVDPAVVAARNPLQTGLLRFVETANGGRISNGATLLRAGDVGIESLETAVFSTPLQIDGERVSLLVPEGVRTTGEDAGSVLWLFSGPDVESASASLQVPETDGGRFYWLPTDEFFPDPNWRLTASSDAGPQATGRSIPGWPSGGTDGGK
ncbi:phage tail protein, partial [Halodesulfurarchaeum sp.]|uniref:phage tail protein n=1 Tax=Halodesulfurarchaeum sp. TaxID=1980530 RepID=UPI002FC31503